MIQFNAVRYLQFPIILLLLLITASACSPTNKMVGLWQIEKVSVGTEEMTPIAKWTLLNKNYTQTSGNGWLQHTIGDWSYDKKQQEIRLNNTNGMEDEYGGFTVKFAAEKMIWQRQEEGQEVKVTLAKIDQIPESPANHLFGVWQLTTDEESNENEAYSHLMIRWDQIIVMRKPDGIRAYGMYKPHGHKPEVQVIHYEDPLRSSIWIYNLEGSNLLTLNYEEDGESIQLEYKRVRTFP
ncbi:MAG: hypothetical protein AAGJ93_04395 [Bacteroidota bacterium]